MHRRADQLQMYALDHRLESGSPRDSDHVARLYRSLEVPGGSHAEMMLERLLARIVLLYINDQDLL